MSRSINLAAIITILLFASVLHAQEKNAIQQKSQIAIPFTLKDAGYVTLVIENKDGFRIRNLLSETWFNAGKNTVYWDGLDDLGRDENAANKGIYSIPAEIVAPGTYKVHGIVHSKITPTYEFSVYNTGTPPWRTTNSTGGWLANHAAPQAALFVPANQSPTGEPAVFLGSYMTEGPDSFIWTNLEGKKLGGKKWIGGNWTGAPFLARDAGDKADKKIFAYAGSMWSRDKTLLELRITGITADKDKEVFKDTIGKINPDLDVTKEMGGMAVYNGTGVISVRNKLIVINLETGKRVKEITINEPKGLAFDATGRLLVLTGNKLMCYNNISLANNTAPKVIIDKDLEAPIGITLDDAGQIYISDNGNSHQVKIFSKSGKFIRAIGKPGKPAAGPYDPLHINNPAGIAVDSKQQLWVTENNHVPKRVSVWSLNGDLIKAFYGPSKYGGGGTLDGHDKNKFYYADSRKGTIEFSIDWKTGENTLKNVLYKRNPGVFELPKITSAPETAIYHNRRRFFTNCFNSNPTNGTNIAFLFSERNGKLYPAAAMGDALKWDILQQDNFASRWPDASLNKSTKKATKKGAFFIWIDLNDDVVMQPEEVVITTGTASGVTVQDDLSFCLSLNKQAVQFKPEGYTKDETPVYKIDKYKVLANNLSGRASTGGDQTLVTPDGWMITTQGMGSYSKYSISGAKDGKAVWSYPNMWPGLHASHRAPLPDFAGELIGTTRLLGGFMATKQKSGKDALWAVNSNHGMVYIFTADGLFVTTLFKPSRTGKKWNMEKPVRGMDLDSLTLSEENFWPSITQTEDGNVYLQDGKNTSLVQIHGLETIERLEPITLNVTQNDIDKYNEHNSKNQVLKSKPNNILTVATNKKITVDGVLPEWENANWAAIDKRKSQDVTGAVAVNSGKIYFAYRTGNKNLLKNSGELQTAPFKTGGALDIMISNNPDVNDKRIKAAEGDMRLLVTIVKNKPYALLYTQVAAGTKQTDRVPFSSPQRTVTFDKVEDISEKIEFAASKSGNYEISVPLSLLKLSPKTGMAIKGDLGILRGDGEQTTARIYWSNKDAGIVSDVPSEAELTPALWGTWKFE